MTILDRETSGLRLTAQVYLDNRTAPRMPAERQVTLRTEREEPVDAMIEDLSLSGFGMSTLADLPIGSVVGLSIGGALRRRVKIVRRVGLAYGCEFLTPLSDLEVNSALRAGDVVEANFLTGPHDESATRSSTRKLSYLAKLYILIGLLAALWAIVIYGAVHLR
ncbi:PilZ domain-containing protein [Sphingomonas sp. GB1N7]|uniref:PilZ domain-containing protein n=1 Tax=Parasphingomonas caseinilytica TaxID=3096158 RepID=UPI002FC8EE53